MNKKLTIEELKLIMGDQWSEIENGIKILHNKDLVFGGKNYQFMYWEEEDGKSKYKTYEYNKKLELMYEAYMTDNSIVDILINDAQEWFDILDTNNLFRKVSKGNTEEDMFFIFQNDYQLMSAKATLDYLVEISDKRYYMDKSGISNRQNSYNKVMSTINKENIEVINSNSKYKNHINSMSNTFTEHDKQSLLKRFNNGCAFTDKKDSVEFDHVIPISWRVFGTTVNNILPLNKALNVSKSNRNIFKWYEDNKDKYCIEESRFVEAITYIAELNDMSYIEYRDFLYNSEQKVIERMKDLEVKVRELEIQKAKLDNEIFKCKCEQIHLF